MISNVQRRRYVVEGALEYYATGDLDMWVMVDDNIENAEIQKFLEQEHDHIVALSENLVSILMGTSYTQCRSNEPSNHGSGMRV